MIAIIPNPQFRNGSARRPDGGAVFSLPKRGVVWLPARAACGQTHHLFIQVLPSESDVAWPSLAPVAGPCVAGWAADAPASRCAFFLGCTGALAGGRARPR